MLANPTPLRVVPFENPSGQIVHRVHGMHGGKRIRKNFKDPVKAQAFINARITVAPGAAIPRPVITVLTDAQVRDAEAAVFRLPKGASLGKAVDYFLANFRGVEARPLPLAAADYRAWLLKERKTKIETADRLKSNLLQFGEAAEIQTTDEITPDAARGWVYEEGRSERTQRDRFDWLNAFCAWLVRRKHAETNIMEALDRPVVKIDAPGVLTFEETWNLLQCALTDAEGPEMLPFFAICALSGVRPGEVPRLSDEAVDATGKPDPWADIHLTDEHRLIEVNKAKGGRSRRNVSIGDPLWRILTWSKERGLAPNYFSKRKFNRIRRRAGLSKCWEKDLLRHTYASHVYILTKDTKKLTGDMGNSEDVLFQHYIRPVPLVDGQRMAGLCLHYSAPREKSAMGTGPKPRKKPSPIPPP